MLRSIDLESPPGAGLLIKDPNVLGNQKGDALFVVAASKGESELVSMWLCGSAISDGEGGTLVPVSQRNINLAFKAAMVNAKFATVELLLSHITSIKVECSDSSMSALTLAVTANRLDVVRALIKQRLIHYVQEKASEMSGHTPALYSARGSLFSKEEEVGAAAALIVVLEGAASYAAIAERHGAIKRGELAKLASLVRRYHADEAVALRAVTEQTPLIDRYEKSEGCCDRSRCLVM